MIDRLRHATPPHSLLIGLKQAGLITNRFYIPFGQLSCPYLYSFKPISPLSPLFYVVIDEHRSVDPVASSADGLKFRPDLPNVDSFPAKSLSLSHAFFRRKSKSNFLHSHVVVFQNCSHRSVDAFHSSIWSIDARLISCQSLLLNLHSYNLRCSYFTSPIAATMI